VGDAWIAFKAEQNAVRLSIRQVSARRGVGTYLLMFAVEAAAIKPAVSGLQFWLSGDLSVGGAGGGYISRVVAANEPITLGEPGGNQHLALQAQIDPVQIVTIEEARTAGVDLTMDLEGHWQTSDQAERIMGVRFEHPVSQSEWLNLLEQVGYKRSLLLELAMPPATQSPEWRAAFDYFQQAEVRYHEHDWRQSVEALRQCLAALVAQPDDVEDTDAEIAGALKQARQTAMSTALSGYGSRFELLRRALKFATDLAAHPEAGETTRQDAHATYVMTAGLLAWFTRS
jgi:hypothetical protein